MKPIILRMSDGQEIELGMTKEEFEATITSFGFVVISEIEWIGVGQIIRVQFPIEPNPEPVPDVEDEPVE